MKRMETRNPSKQIRGFVAELGVSTTQTTVPVRATMSHKNTPFVILNDTGMKRASTDGDHF